MTAVLERPTTTEVGPAPAFRVARRDFLRAITAASKVVAGRTTLPVLQNVLIEAVPDGELRIAATNLEMDFEMTVPAQVGRGGAFTVSAADLRQLVGGLPEGEVNAALEGTRAVFRCGGTRFAMATEPAEDMPSIREPADTAPILRLQASDLRTLLELALPTVSEDSTRQNLCAVLLEAEPGQLRGVSTDQHRLSCFTLPLAGSTLQGVWLLPSGAAGKLRDLLEDGEVELIPEASQVTVRGGGFRFWSRLVEGKFPEYRRVIPKAHRISAEFDREAVQGALRRLGVFASDVSGKDRVTLAFDPSGLTISAESEAGRVDEQFDAPLPEPFSIIFAFKYLETVLRMATSERVRVEMDTPISNTVFHEVDGSRDWLALVCPIQPR